jgi:hypothetical protein
MIYNILNHESSESDSLPKEWKLAASQRSDIRIRPPKIIQDITGLFVISSFGSPIYLGQTRYPTLALNGVQPNFDILVTSIEVIK